VAFSPLSAAPLPAAPASPSSYCWVRHPLLEGLELHIREDFRYPTTPQERDALLQLIAHVLTPPPPGASASSSSPSISSPSRSWSTTPSSSTSSPSKRRPPP
jgi:hypothetical protein